MVSMKRIQIVMHAEAQELRTILEQRGFCVDLVSSGEAALATFANNDDVGLSAVICSIDLPGMSGYDFCRNVRGSQQHKIASLPLILTAASGSEDVVSCLESGANALFYWPDDGPVIATTLELLLEEISNQKLLSIGGELNIFGKRIRHFFSNEGLTNLLISSYERNGHDTKELETISNSTVVADQATDPKEKSVDIAPVSSEHQLQTWSNAFQALNIGLLILKVSDDESIVIDANTAVCSIFGCNLSDIQGRSITDFFKQVGAEDNLYSNFRSLFKNNKAPKVIRMRHAQGYYIWCQITCAEITDLESKTVRPENSDIYTCNIQDITEKHQSHLAMNALSKRTQRESDYFKYATTELSKILNTDYAFICEVKTHSNEVTIKTIALTKNHKIVKNISYKLIPSLAETFLNSEMLYVKNGARKLHPEIEFFRENGIESYAAVKISSGDGRPNSHLGVFSCAPLRKKSDDLEILQTFCLSVAAVMLRQRSRNEYEELFEFAPDAMLLTNLQGTIQLANQKTLETFGYTKEEIIGASVEMLVPDDLHQGHINLRNHYSQKPVSRHINSDKSQLEAKRKDGSVFPIDISLSPVETQYGAMIAVAARDKTLQLAQENDRKAREIAERSDAAKSAFLAHMSHEIRTPINGIIGSLELLMLETLSQNQKDLAEAINESSHCLLEVIDEVLDFSKLEADMLKIEAEPVALKDIIRNTCKAFWHFAHNKNVKLFHFVDPELPNWILGDKIRLQQILNNLVSNAIKFSTGLSCSGYVYIRATLLGENKMRLTVADNGIGFSEDFQMKLFQPYSQAETSTSRRYGGTGLGLSICKQLLDKMGGKIHANSAPKKGSTFTIDLPFEAYHDRYTPEESGDISGLTCIVLSDSPCQVQDWCTYLNHGNAKAEGYTSFNAATSAIQKSQISSFVLITTFDKEAVTKWLKTLELDREPSLVFVEDSGQCRKPRFSAPNIVHLDAEHLNIDTLLLAVSASVGRTSLEEKNDDIPEAIIDARSVPDRATAIAQGRLVLIAEDNKINQKVISRQLAQLGLQADISEDGRAAFKAFRTGEYSLLLTDLYMPEMDGYELAEAIRAVEPENIHIPIIALTANAMNGEQLICFRAGMDDYLTKPTSLKELEETIDKWMPPTEDTEDTNMNPPVLSSKLESPQKKKQKIFDKSELMKLVGSNDDFIKSLLREYLAFVTADSIKMKEALAKERWSEAGELAHKLKSSALSIGAFAFSDCCDRIDARAKTGVGQNSIELLREFETEFSEHIYMVKKEL